MESTRSGARSVLLAMRLLLNSDRPRCRSVSFRHTTRRRPSWLGLLIVGGLALTGCSDVAPIRDAISTLASQADRVGLADDPARAIAEASVVPATPSPVPGVQTPSSRTPTTRPAGSRLSSGQGAATQPGTTETPTTRPAGGRASSDPTAAEQSDGPQPDVGQPGPDQPELAERVEVLLVVFSDHSSSRRRLRSRS